MPPVYLDGIQLQADHGRLVMNFMGTLNETCRNCGGSVIEVKGVLLRSSASPTIFHTWCTTCGRFSHLSQEFPVEWLRGLLGRIVSELSLTS